MTKLSIEAPWSFTLVNERDEPCCGFEELAVEAEIEIEAGNITSMVVTRVLAEFGERQGLRYTYFKRDLPAWLAERLLPFAQSEAIDPSSKLFESLDEAAGEALELEEEDDSA